MTVEKLIDILSACPRDATVGVINANENPEMDYIGINRVINMAIRCANIDADDNQVIIVTN